MLWKHRQDATPLRQQQGAVPWSVLRHWGGGRKKGLVPVYNLFFRGNPGRGGGYAKNSRANFCGPQNLKFR